MVMKTAPKITIDHSKCQTPFDCKKCLQNCPQVVFYVEAVKVERGKETDAKEPGAFKVEAPFRFACSGCNKCVEVCPVDAITITWP